MTPCEIPNFLPAGGAVSADETATQALGASLAGLLPGPVCISLEGPLGAGKTCFARGFARGLGIDPAVVSSPSFTLVNEYAAVPLPLAHLDLYRLESVADLESIGFEEFLSGSHIVLVEWGDKFPQCLPAGALRLRFEPSEGCHRIAWVR
jgi:tRNA threonylcarbamoyladenosine biosynthesis protein TsaE